MKKISLILLLFICFNLISCDEKTDQVQASVDLSSLVTAPLESESSTEKESLENISFNIKDIGFEEETPTELELEGSQIINLEDNNINLGIDKQIEFSSNTNSTEQTQESVELSTTTEVGNDNLLPIESLPQTGQTTNYILVMVVVFFLLFIYEYKKKIKKADNSK